MSSLSDILGSRCSELQTTINLRRELQEQYTKKIREDKKTIKILAGELLGLPKSRIKDVFLVDSVLSDTPVWRWDLRNNTWGTAIPTRNNKYIVIHFIPKSEVPNGFKRSIENVQE